MNKGFLAKCYLLEETWFEDPTCLASLSNHLTLDSWESENPTFINITDPRILAARTKTSNTMKTIHLLTQQHVVLFRQSFGKP